MNVKDEKKANIIMVIFETSISPNWKDTKIFIQHFYKNININPKKFLKRTTNLKELQHQIEFDK